MVGIVWVKWEIGCIVGSFRNRRIRLSGLYVQCGCDEVGECMWDLEGARSAVVVLWVKVVVVAVAFAAVGALPYIVDQVGPVEC